MITEARLFLQSPMWAQDLNSELVCEFRTETEIGKVWTLQGGRGLLWDLRRRRELQLESEKEGIWGGWKR